MKKYLFLAEQLEATNWQILRMERILAQHKAAGIRPLQDTLDLHRGAISRRAEIQRQMTAIENRFCELLPTEILIRIIITGETVKLGI